jgi:hypothetical protein
MPDFAPVVNRIRRADEHATRLAVEVAAYVASPPYRRTLEETDRGTLLDKVVMERDPPPDIALTLSDGVHQLRAALDNLVGVLRSGGPTERTAFVLEPDPAKFEHRARVELDGLSGDHLAMIRRLQPFPDNPWRHLGDLLVTLHNLARIDRHRAPLLQVALPKPYYAEGTVLEWRSDRRTWVSTEYVPGELNDVHYTVGVVIAEPIAGAEGREAATFLTHLAGQVDWIVDEIARGVFLDTTAGPWSPEV